MNLFKNMEVNTRRNGLIKIESVCHCLAGLGVRGQETAALDYYEF